MKKVIFLGFLLYSVSNLFGQGAGFLGKHFYLSSNFCFSPAIINPTLSGSKGWNTKGTIVGEYIINRKSSFNLNFSTFSTGLPTDKWCKVTYKETNSTTYGTYGMYFNEAALMKVTSFGAGIKLFSFGSLAPVGFYSNLEIGYLSYEVDADSLKSKIIQSIKANEGLDVSLINFGDEEQYRTFAVNFKFGFHRIFAKRIVFNAAIQTGIVVGGLNYFFEDYPEEGLYEPDRTSIEYLDKIGKFRLLGYNCLNFELGAGLLLF